MPKTTYEYREKKKCCGVGKRKNRLKGTESTSVFNYWGSNEDSESNKQFVFQVLSHKLQ